MADTVRANSIMMAAGPIPGITLSRCLQQARREGTLLRVLTLDATGMFIGMTLLSLLPFAAAARWQPIVSHMLMLAGMLAGMGAAMITRGLLTRKKELLNAATEVRGRRSLASLRVVWLRMSRQK